MQSFYRLDERDRIAECRGDWDRFALDNGSSRSMARAVQGRMIWDFVDGIDMSSYLGAIFFHVRREVRPFESSYRCDSPYRARRFAMRVETSSGGLLLTHRMTWHGIIRDVGPDLPGDGALSVPRCSVCCRFHAGQAWIDPVAAPERVFVPASHCVCPACKAELRARLAV
ncbi:hypothetical protein [Mangrovicoccus ximenensis]|uniref:hypothetical protein n=1 Tax=Mangrovicoccus ximenensis TaxID=1911570 RepID=UPI0011AE50CF|nr:hypothetical protein [Mangrovicoccus ximenensis]